MHGHPTLGVKGAKPRLSSRPGPQIGKLSEEYLEIRNRQMSTKALIAEMHLAERRGELIKKKLVEHQAAYLLVAMRQAALNIPQAYARRILNIAEPRKAKEILKEAMISLLNTIKDLPNAVSDPDWLATLEKDDSI
jgi:hypothetical protein